FEVGGGVAVIDVAGDVLGAAVIEDALGGGGLASVHVRDDADIANFVEHGWVRSFRLAPAVKRHTHGASLRALNEDNKKTCVALENRFSSVPAPGYLFWTAEVSAGFDLSPRRRERPGWGVGNSPYYWVPIPRRAKQVLLL